MRCLQYFYVFIVFVLILSKWLNLTTATYWGDDKRDIQVFVSSLNVIRTWELNKIVFTENELEQIESIIIYGTQNPENVELNTKFERKMTSLKCTYGHAVQNILSNLKYLLLSQEESTDDNPSSANATVNEQIKKKVMFNEKVKLLAIDKNSKVPMSEKIQKNPLDLRDENGYRTQEVNAIIDDEFLDQEYLIDLQTNELFSLSSGNIQNYVKGYKLCVNKMLSVMFMAKRDAASWLWNVSIMLSAVRKYPIQLKTLCQHNEINATVNHFVVQCTKNNYLNRIPQNDQIVYGLGNNSNQRVYSLNRSAKLMDIMGLLNKSDNDLVGLFKYEQSMDIYDFFWEKRQFDKHLISNPRLNNIDWHDINEALSKAHRNMQNVRVIDPFAIVNYYLLIMDVVSITLLYHLLQYFMAYIKLRWPIWKQTVSFKKTIQGSIPADWSTNIPIQVLKDYLSVLDLNDDTFYKEVIHYLTEANSIDQLTFQMFTKTISFKLEQLLNRFGVFDKRIYKNMSKQFSIKINKINFSELNDSLNNFYKQFIQSSYPSILNLKIIKFFYNSENETWVLDL